MKKNRKRLIVPLGTIFLLFVLMVFLFVVVRHISNPGPPVRLVDVPEDPDPTYEYAAAPANAPPSVIVVGAFHWRVRYVDFQEDFFGRTSPSHLEIDIDPSLPLDQLKETVLHEVMHACLFVGNSGSSPGKLVDDDAYIESSAPTLLEVLEQNPQLVAWLTQKNF